MNTLTLSTKKSPTLRAWQNECLLTLLGAIDKGESHFTVIATMGSGKTFLQGAFAKQLLDAGLIDWVVNVVPSDTLRENNVSNLRDHFSINLHGTPSYKDNGHIVTFQGLSREGTAVRLLRQLAGKSFLLLIDEVHHGSAEGTAWGDSILALMDEATYTMSLSGTMWRSDNTKIAGVRYKQLNEHCWEVDPHYVYSLGKATQDNTVCDVVFQELCSEVTYLRSDEDGEFLVTTTTNNIKDNEEVNRAFKHVVNPKGGFVRDLLDRANNELIAKQRSLAASHPLAIPPGGLVVCSDITSAEQTAELLFNMTGKPAVVVHSGVPNNKELLSKFAKNELPADWLVSVRMVSEGVDVPRIKVIAYLTKVRTRLSFHQIIGRAMRVRRDHTGEMLNENASVFLPAFAGLHAHVMDFVKDSGGKAIRIEPRKQQPPVEEEEVTDEVEEPTYQRKEEFVHSSGTFWKSFSNALRTIVRTVKTSLLFA